MPASQVMTGGVPNKSVSKASGRGCEDTASDASWKRASDEERRNVDELNAWLTCAVACMGELPNGQ